MTKNPVEIPPDHDHLLGDQDRDQLLVLYQALGRDHHLQPKVDQSLGDLAAMYQIDCVFT